MDESAQIDFRRADEDDLPAIVALFEEFFRKVRSIDRCKWQFMDSGCAADLVMVAEINHDVVAQSAIIRQHIGFLGREIIAGQMCDAMLKASLRGMKVFFSLATRQFEAITDDGVEVAFAFPSRNSSPGSYPMLMHNLGFCRLVNLHSYSFRIGCWPFGVLKLDRLLKI